MESSREGEVADVHGAVPRSVERAPSTAGAMASSTNEGSVHVTRGNVSRTGSRRAAASPRRRRVARASSASRSSTGARAGRRGRRRRSPGAAPRRAARHRAEQLVERVGEGRAAVQLELDRGERRPHAVRGARAPSSTTAWVGEQPACRCDRRAARRRRASPPRRARWVAARRWRRCQRRRRDARGDQDHRRRVDGHRRPACPRRSGRRRATRRWRRDTAGAIAASPARSTARRRDVSPCDGSRRQHERAPASANGRGDEERHRSTWRRHDPAHPPPSGEVEAEPGGDACASPPAWRRPHAPTVR